MELQPHGFPRFDMTATAMIHSHRLLGVLLPIFAVDPVVGLFHPFAKTNAGSLTKIFLDEPVVAVTAVDTLRSRQIVLVFEFRAGDLFDWASPDL